MMVQVQYENRHPIVARMMEAIIGRWAFFIVGAAGLAVSVWLHLMASQSEQRRVEGLIDSHVDVRLNEIAARIKTLSLPVLALTNLFDSGPFEADNSFQQWAENAGKTGVPVARLAWLPLVDDQRRGEFETRQQLLGREGFAIRELDLASRQAVPSRQRERYFPITYSRIFRSEGFPPDIGLDPGFDPYRRSLIMAAEQSGMPQALAPPQPPRPDLSVIVVYWPIFEASEGPASRRTELRGVLMGVFLLRDLLPYLLAREGAWPDTRVVMSPGRTGDDVTAASRLAFDAGTGMVQVEDQPSSRYPVVIQRNLDVFGAPWVVDFKIGDQQLAGLRSSTPDLIFLAGLSITALLLAVLKMGRLAVRDEERARVRAEKMFAESEGAFRDFAELASDWMWRAGGDGKVSLVQRLDGQSTSHPFALSVVSGEARPSDATRKNLRELLNSIAQGRAVSGIEVAFHDSAVPGGFRYILTRGKPVHDVLGQCVDYRAVSTDVTELRLRELAIQAAQRELHALINSLDDGVILFDVTGHVLNVNEPCTRMLHYSQCALLKQNLYTLLPAVSGYRGVLEKGPRLRFCDMLTIGRDENCEARRGDGSSFPFELAIRELPGEGGIRRFVGTLRDITERNRLDRERGQIRRMEAMGQLTGGVAHDFNNLLSIILANLEELGEKLPLSSPIASAVVAAMQAASRGRDLTRRLLSASRGKSDLRTSVDVEDALDGLHLLLGRTLGDSIAVDVRAKAHLGRVRLDAGTFEAALLNLAVNARDAMPRGGSLTINAERRRIREHRVLSPGDYVLIKVRDTGDGIPADIQDRIFEPFFTTKPPELGTGLGLSMVYAAARQAGGHIEVSSAPGKGSEFCLFLGIDSQQEEGASAGARERAAIKDRSVLLVEDNLDLQAIITERLRRLGLEVTSCAQAESALSLLRQGQLFFDIILSDVALRGSASGIDLAEYVRAQNSHVAIVLMTGNPNSPSLADRAEALGVEILMKPFETAELGRALGEALQKSLGTLTLATSSAL